LDHRIIQISNQSFFIINFNKKKSVDKIIALMLEKENNRCCIWSDNLPLQWWKGHSLRAVHIHTSISLTPYCPQNLYNHFVFKFIWVPSSHSILAFTFSFFSILLIKNFKPVFYCIIILIFIYWENLFETLFDHYLNLIIIPLTRMTRKMSLAVDSVVGIGSLVIICLPSFKDSTSL